MHFFEPIQNRSKLKIGAIKWYDSTKGFGVIGKPDATEAFLLSSNFLGSSATLKMGEVLLFDETFERNKTTAKKAHVPTSCKDFAVVMSLYSGRKYVTASQKVTRKSRWGNPYRTTESRTFDVFEIGLKKICENMDSLALSDCIKNFYLEEVATKHPQSFTDIFNLLEPQLKEKKGVDFPFLDIYNFFGRNLNPEILFNTWGKKEFRLIGYDALNESEDYEIPEDVLWENREKLNPKLLKRIIAYTFGQRFCENYMEWLCENSDGNSLSEILLASPFESIKILEKSDEYLTLLEKLNQLIKEAFLKELNDKCGQIADADDFESFENLFTIIPSGLPEELKNELRESIKKNVIELCSENVAFKLWQKGKIDNYNFDKVKVDFESEDLSKHGEIFNLLKSDNERIEIIRLLISSEKWEYMFDLLSDYLKSSNGLGYGFSLQGKLHELDYWNGKKGSDLVEEVISQIEGIDDQKLRVEFFKKGYSNNYSQEFVFATLEKYSIDEIEKFLSVAEEGYSLKVLSKRIELFYELEDLRKILNLGLRALTSNSFQKLDKHCFENTELASYFKLWKEGLAEIFPERQIISLFDDDEKSYDEIDEWISDGLVKSQLIEQLMFDKLLSVGEVDDRIKFYTTLNLIQKLVTLNQEWINKVHERGNELFQIILWFLEKTNEFIFDELKRKFIYFKPEGQVIVLKKLFFHKAQGHIDFTINKLRTIIDYSHEQMKLGNLILNGGNVDISSEAIIESVKSYTERSKFLVESELMSVILRNLYDNKKQKFQFGGYFENCLGRSVAKWNFDNNGVISKVKYGNNQFYFAIHINKGETQIVSGRWSDYEKFIPNPNFDSILEKVKTLPGRKWNKEKLHWGVPSRFEENVLSFAKENRFLVEFGGNKFEDNPHFVEVNRKGVPSGVLFCEGRLSQNENYKYKRKFWWCENQPCFENCETLHSALEWRDYTLLDFCKILGLNLDEQGKSGFYPNGHYYQFISKINRFNRLLEKMYCQSCEQILYPVESSDLAAHNVVRFSCHDEKCSEFKKVVYLNHCLNGQCNSIIDSRESKRCNYHNHHDFSGLYICSTCGSCCSHAMLSRGLEKRERNNRYIPNELRVKVGEQLGHLERAEYFCYKCGNDMVEYSSTLFRCDDCEVEYDLDRFKLKHPNKHMRRSDYPKANGEEY